MQGFMHLSERMTIIEDSRCYSSDTRPGFNRAAAMSFSAPLCTYLIYPTIHTQEHRRDTAIF